MADVAVIILQVVAAIHEIAKDIKENDRQAHRLFERVTAIEPAVLAVKNGKKLLFSSESLGQLLETVDRIRNFLDGYARTTKINRALKRKSNAARFTDFGVVLSEGMQVLQLDVAVDVWAKEDASDRLEDLENLIDMMEELERKRTDNHAEVMGALKVSMERDPILFRTSDSPAFSLFRYHLLEGACSLFRLIVNELSWFDVWAFHLFVLHDVFCFLGSDGWFTTKDVHVPHAVGVGLHRARLG